jgi:hypothetical protein
VARPPSLFVTVESAAWSKLPPDDRRSLVDTASSVLMTSDYRGALLRTEDGRPVAQWLARTGVRLLDANERDVAGERLSTSPTFPGGSEGDAAGRSAAEPDPGP